MGFFIFITVLAILLVGIRKFVLYATVFGGVLLLSIVLDKYWNITPDIGYLPSLGATCLALFIKEYLIPRIQFSPNTSNTNRIRIKFVIRKVGFYFFLWTGMILTSMFFDKFLKISDEIGYAIGLGVWLFLIAFIEFVIPLIKKRGV